MVFRIVTLSQMLLTKRASGYIIYLNSCSNSMRIKHLGQICIGPTLSERQIDKVNSVLNKDKLLSKRVKIHKLLSGETRYKVLKLLKDLKELCVCDMAEILDTTVSAVSHQLRLLRKENVVSTRRKGQTIYYSLTDKKIKRFL